MIATLAGAGLILAAVVMTLLWLWDRRVRNAAIADAGWALLVGGLAVFDAVLGDGWPPRRAAIGFMMGSWGARLGVYLLYDRVFGRAESGRYAGLPQNDGRRGRARRFWYFETHAAGAVFFSLPAWFAVLNKAEGFAPLELAAAGLWMVAFSGEMTADRQLERFRADAASSGRVCQAGLWRTSRHPNYFFEWLMWIAYAMFAAGSPWGWSAAACPALMLFLLVKVTGMPRTETQALRSREAYREYQRTTSAFVPWRRRE